MQQHVTKLGSLFFVGICAANLTQTSYAIGLDANFDHASLDVNNTWYSSSSNTLHIDGRKNYYHDEWKWIYFKADGVQNNALKFSIPDNFVAGGYKLNNHKMVYSYDQTNWHYFDKNYRDGNGNYKFYNYSAFNQNEVYVAYAFPYSYGKSVAHTQSLISNPCVQPTASADANFVIGQSPGGVDDIGRTITPKNLFAYKITDTSATTPKKKIVLTTGLHANEVLGTHTFEGMINMLTSDDWRMKYLRQYAEFYVYPMTNPDGRYAGYNRSTVAMPETDPNRVWKPSKYQGESWKDIRTTAEAMMADTDSDIDYFIDFHSTIPTSDNEDFAYIPEKNKYDKFWLNLKDLESQLIYKKSSGSGYYTANFADDYLDAEFDMTFETMFSLNRELDYYYDMGENFAVAFYEALVPDDVPEPSSLILLGILSAGLISRKK